MAEENQIAKQIQVMTKDPKRVEVGKRVSEYNHIRKEELKVHKIKYDIVANLAVRIICGVGYYLYQAKKRKVNSVPPKDNNVVPPQQPP